MSATVKFDSWTEPTGSNWLQSLRCSGQSSARRVPSVWPNRGTASANPTIDGFWPTRPRQPAEPYVHIPGVRTLERKVGAAVVAIATCDIGTRQSPTRQSLCGVLQVCVIRWPMSYEVTTIGTIESQSSLSSNADRNVISSPSGRYLDRNREPGGATPGDGNRLADAFPLIAFGHRAAWRASRRVTSSSRTSSFEGRAAAVLNLRSAWCSTGGRTTQEKVMSTTEMRVQQYKYPRRIELHPDLVRLRTSDRATLVTTRS
jgi:hypothetical protein